jgi:4-hydroxy-tetrahydrodipicolinate synthase
MNTEKLNGTGVAIVTPFRNDKSIDFQALNKIIDFQINNGVDYLVVLGTTGESVTLSKDEKNAIIDFTIEHVNNRVPIVVGYGGNNTQEVMNNILQRDFKNIDAILSVSPYYNKPTQEGLYQHYKAIADVCPVPVILYNVPGRTGSNMNAETTLELSKIKNIVAVKEASGNMSQIMKIIKNKPANFKVISGDDSLALPIVLMGGVGVISVAANAIPKECSSMINAALNGNIEEAKKIHYRIIDFMESIFIDGNPAGIKAAMNHLGLLENNLRLPLVPATAKTTELLNRLINEIQKNK